MAKMHAAKEPEAISKAHLATGRAVDQLRRQLGIVLEDTSGQRIGACPLEGLTPKLLAGLGALPKKRLGILLTAARARRVKLDPKQSPVAYVDVQGWPLSAIQALADPLAPAEPVPKAKTLPTHPAHETLMTLAKYASLLPALLVVESDFLPEDWLPVTRKDIEEYWAAPPLDMVPLVGASLPVIGAEETRIACFRSRYGTSMHLALLIGKPEKETAPLVRIHSSCITGDILGSLRCDCGDQLQLALSQIVAANHGVLLYLHQEGRGIGIANKLRAYALQERGIDTYEANLLLGFDEDERDFAIAAAMLKKLGLAQIRLMTNNPHKLNNVKLQGLTVKERVPLIVPSGRHNHAYLEAKAKKSGHLF